jgi:hypothetical protein
MDLIQNWAQGAQLPAGAFNPQTGLCGFRVMDKFDVTIELPPNADDVFVFIDLLPSEGGELGKKRITEAMRLNAYATQTRGAILGWDEDRDMIMLSYRVTPEALTPELFGNMIVNLVDTAQLMSRELAFDRDAMLTKQSHQHAAKWFEPVRV